MRLFDLPTFDDAHASVSQAQRPAPRAGVVAELVQLRAEVERRRLMAHDMPPCEEPTALGAESDKHW